MAASPKQAQVQSFAALRRLLLCIGLAIACIAGSAAGVSAATDSRALQVPPPAPTATPTAPPAAPAGEMLQLAPIDPQQRMGAQPAGLSFYFTDFSSYALGEIPSDWSWLSQGSGLLEPNIIYFGGGVTNNHKRLEILDQPVGGAESWLLKNDVYYGPATQVEAIVNFQSDDEGMAGVVFGYKDFNNYAALLLDQVNDTVWVFIRQDGETTWQNNGPGSTPIAIDTDYRLSAYPSAPMDRGRGHINVWLETPGKAQSYLFTSENPIDLRGRMGIGVMNGLPRVVFDSFWVVGELLPEPSVNWSAPVKDGATWDVYGDSIRLAHMATNDIAIWLVQVMRYDAGQSAWVLVDGSYGPPPYRYDFATGVLDFGSNEFKIELYTIDNRRLQGPSIWLNRLRVPESIAVLSAGPVLIADGQSTAQIVLEPRDRGGNPLPGVPVTFAGQNVSVQPQSAMTNDDGQAIVTVTAGTAVGAGLVTYHTDNLKGKVPVTLTPGPAAVLQLTPWQNKIVIGETAAVSVTLRVRDAYNHPLAGETVFFSTTLGSITPSATTNANGVARATLQHDQAAGRALVTASAGSLAAQTEVMFKTDAASLYLALVRYDEAMPVLLNGAFDAGATGWSQTVNGLSGKLIYHQSENSTIPTPVNSPYVAWLGGKGSQVNQLYQAMALPKSYVVALEYWYFTKSYEIDCTHDTAGVYAVVGSYRYIIRRIELCSAADTESWRRDVIELGVWREASAIMFESTLDGRDNSNLFLDNVRFCSSDPAAPATMPDCGQ
jgi:hypothetical protein